MSTTQNPGTQMTPVEPYFSTPPASRLIIWLVALIILIEVGYPRLKKNAEEPTRHQTIERAFPQAVCAGWEDVSYEKVFDGPIEIELSPHCNKNITLPSGYNITHKLPFYIKFLGGQPKVFLPDRDYWFEGNGSYWKTGKSGQIIRVVSMRVASLPGSNTKISISPYEKPDRKKVEVTPEMTEYTGRNLPD